MTHIASNILVSILATALIMQHEISGWMDGWVPHLYYSPLRLDSTYMYMKTVDKVLYCK